MNTNKTETQAGLNSPKNNQGFFVQPRAYLSNDGEYLTLVLPGNILVRKHVNFFKSVMGIPFTRKTQPSTEATESQVA